MKLKYSLTALLVSCGVAHGANLLTPGDFIIAIGSTGSEFPGGEQPTAVIDGTPDTKYLNFGKANSGFIVTPGSGSSVAQSAVFRTANDAPERDPSNVSIYGTNDPIGSVINGTGSKENWTLISSFDANLPNDRLTTSAPIDFTNGTAYSSYRVKFDSLKDNNAVSQLDEFQLFSGSGGGGSSILGAADSIISFDTDVTASSNFPGGEAPRFAIDGSIDTKHLNFQGRGTGFIVTPSAGASVISAFTLTTGDDAPSRDPNAYVIYGTNDAITSAENSTGSNESWTLIQAGTLSPPIARKAAYDSEAIANGAAYTSYRFDVLGNNDNLVQYSEIQFDGTFIPEPSSAMLALLGLLPVLRRRR
ncbi:discoidin domain-containing protein [Akkermansiaceae bacterium]|nr:discoidin domain-containing protein [Akkermansiaceae bacterium]